MSKPLAAYAVRGASNGSLSCLPVHHGLAVGEPGGPAETESAGRDDVRTKILRHSVDWIAA